MSTTTLVYTIYNLLVFPKIYLINASQFQFFLHINTVGQYCKWSQKQTGIKSQFQMKEGVSGWDLTSEIGKRGVGFERFLCPVEGGHQYCINVIS